MHSLVLYAHVDPDSLTASMARRLTAGLEAAGWTAETADIAAEGFDPRMTAADLDVLRGVAGPPADVLREQERVERADAIVILHPVYWWSMPALLKGWFDRVLTAGWAFGGETATALAGRDVHIVRLGGNSPATYESHGYGEALRVSVEHGVFEFAGSPVVSSHLLHTAPDGVGGRADDAVEAILASVTGARAPVLS